MKYATLATSLLVAIVVIVALSGGDAGAYERYNSGCQATGCHGAFTSAVSPKGSTIPSNNKHTMHRNAAYMATKCALCHRSDDNNDPFIGSSDGTTINLGIGCTGCHVAAGLQRHHIANGVTVCSTCHTSIPVPPPENVSPPYYGTADTLAKNPCNPVAQNLVNENWTTNCCEGMDTDGDNVYDGADPDCSAVPQTPGEASAASQMRVTAYDKVGGTVTISYGTACVATDNRIEHGLLGGLSSYSYAGQVCAIGNTGTASFTIPNGSFFLVVANDASKEGSYGERRTGTTLAERPEDMTSLTCPLPQDLANRCDP